jgi:hypothetical protein
MNINLRTLAICGSVAAAFTGTAQAQITFSESAVGSSTLFPSTSISGNNGSLAFSDINSSVSGDTIAGGVSQGVGSSASGYSWGETFLWTSADSSVNGNVLGAFSMVVNAAASGNVYTPFLYDLGSGPGAYNSTSFSFNTSTEVNLLDGSSITMSGLSAGPQSFLEFDFAGSDQAALTVGQEYAFGLVNVGTEGNIFFQRSNGAQADPNGAPFATSTAPTDAYAAYGGGPRNEFIGLYTVQAVPEPGIMALTGLAGLMGMLVIRRRK